MKKHISFFFFFVSTHSDNQTLVRGMWVGVGQIRAIHTQANLSNLNTQPKTVYYLSSSSGPKPSPLTCWERRKACIILWLARSFEYVSSVHVKPLSIRHQRSGHNSAPPSVLHIMMPYNF